MTKTVLRVQVSVTAETSQRTTGSPLQSDSRLKLIIRWRLWRHQWQTDGYSKIRWLSLLRPLMATQQRYAQYMNAISRRCL
jgi:hypothetical protein